MEKGKVLPTLALVVATALSGLSGPWVNAASHREAPLIANDPTADITDFYMFKSWEDPSKVVFIINVIPAEEPSSGPNYFNFSDDVLYSVNIDADGDGKAEDIVYEIRFTTEIRPPLSDLPVANAGVDPVPGLPPAITALDGPGSEGFGVRQRYIVTEVRGKSRRDLNTGAMFAVPSNMGPRTMPNYEALAAKGIYQLSNGGRAFAGQRDETFYIDLGATFDSLNFRQAPILSDADDNDDTKNPFGVDMFSGFNVNSIAIEVPISAITSNPNAVIGAYASTARPRGTLRRGAPDKVDTNDRDKLLRGKGKFVQIARLGNPLVNELIIGTGQKDVWNATDPEREANFLGFYTTSRLAAVINAAFGTPFPTTNRDDLVKALLTYPGQSASCPPACSELLRLNLGVAPTSPANQKRLTVLKGDNAGWPNGRRPNDDVTDVALRVVGGLLKGVAVPNLGDGVNFNVGAPGAGVSDGPGYGSAAGNHLDTTANGIAAEFPFLPTPHDGRGRRHIDPGE